MSVNRTTVNEAIDHLSATEGVESVVLDIRDHDPSESRYYRGLEEWHGILDKSIELFNIANVDSVRLIVGKHTLIIQNSEYKGIAAVALPTGHPVAKSVRRMLRRALKRVAGKSRSRSPKKSELMQDAVNPNNNAPGAVASDSGSVLESDSPNSECTPVVAPADCHSPSAASAASLSK